MDYIKYISYLCSRNITNLGRLLQAPANPTIMYTSLNSTVDGFHIDMKVKSDYMIITINGSRLIYPIDQFSYIDALHDAIMSYRQTH